MKIFIRFLLLMVVIGISGLFVMKRPDGEPWLDAKTIVPDVSVATGFVMDVKKWVSGFWSEQEVEPFGQTKVYRWRDEEGFWQLSDTPPVGGDAEVVFINPDTNLIQGLPSDVRATEKPQDTANALPSGIPLPLTISPKQVNKLIQDAKGVSETLNKRNQDLEAIASGQYSKE